MTRTSTPVLVRLETLQPHPRNCDIYEDDNRTKQEIDVLKESNQSHGLWEGHINVHKQTNTVLDGHRRLALCKELGITEAVVSMHSHLPDDVNDPEVLLFLLNGNTHREKTNVEKLHEYELRKEIETALAKRRQSVLNNEETASDQPDRERNTGEARHLAARKAGLTTGTKGGARVEKAAAALKTAEAIKETDPETSEAIINGLNKSLNAGVSLAAALTPGKKRTRSSAKKSQIISDSRNAEGKRVRNLHRCKTLPGYRSQHEYFATEMPKLIDKLNAAERQMRKMGERLRDEFVHDRSYPEYMTVWSEAWAEEGFDFQETISEANRKLSLLNGARDGFLRLVHTDEVEIDRSEPS
jgi:ParB-like chromosome segregation protein Spo0J